MFCFQNCETKLSEMFLFFCFLSFSDKIATGDLLIPEKMVKIKKIFFTQNFHFFIFHDLKRTNRDEKVFFQKKKKLF